MGHENQQDEHSCDSEYLGLVSSKHSCHSIFYRSISRLVSLIVTREAAIYLCGDVIANSFGGW